MTPLTGHESAEDSIRAYAFAASVERLRLLISGEVLPLESDGDRMDIVVMAALREAT